jgi:HTH-type transcriptional regulator/antitoxin HipB
MVHDMDFPILTADQLQQHLRSLRKARGLTQAGLGKLLGVGQVRIANIEQDPGAVSVEQFMRLLSALGARLIVRTDVTAGPDQRPARKVARPPAAAPAADLKSALSKAKRPKGSW